MMMCPRNFFRVALALLVCPLPLEAEPVFSLSTTKETLAIEAAAIAEIDVSESGGITDLFVRLMPSATADFADMTGASVGLPLTVRVCGTVLMTPVVRGRIDTGTLYLAGTTMVRAEAIRALWHGRASCETLAPEVFQHGQ